MDLTEVVQGIERGDKMEASLLQMALKLYGPPKDFMVVELTIEEDYFFAEIQSPGAKSFSIPKLTIPVNIRKQGHTRSVVYILHTINDHFSLRPGQPLNFIIFLKGVVSVETFLNFDTSHEEIAGRKLRVFPDAISEWINSRIG